MRCSVSAKAGDEQHQRQRRVLHPALRGRDLRVHLFSDMRTSSTPRTLCSGEWAWQAAEEQSSAFGMG